MLGSKSQWARHSTYLPLTLTSHLGWSPHCAAAAAAAIELEGFTHCLAVPVIPTWTLNIRVWTVEEFNLNFGGCWSAWVQLKLHLITWVSYPLHTIAFITSLTKNYIPLHILHHLTHNYMHYICYMLLDVSHLITYDYMSYMILHTLTCHTITSNYMSYIQLHVITYKYMHYMELHDVTCFTSHLDYWYHMKLYVNIWFHILTYDFIVSIYDIIYYIIYIWKFGHKSVFLTNCFFFAFYSVCKTKQTDHCMNASGDSMNGCCTFDFDLELKKRSSLATSLDKNSYTFHWIPINEQIPMFFPLLT